MAIDLGQKSQSIGNSAETTPHYAARLPERHDPIAPVDWRQFVEST
ncbi:MAG TPA: hypothetical protein V6D46_02375 [Coleofasciculaceae cyanobacterium]